MKLYVDATTLNNGQRGFQKTTIYVADENGKLLFSEYIGDFTINEGELRAIIAAISNIKTNESKHIFSDSQIAVNRTLNGLTDYESQALKLGIVKFPKNQFFEIVQKAHKLFTENDCVVEWAPREQNIAGMVAEFG